MSKLMDVIAKSMELALAGKVHLHKIPDGYDIFTVQHNYYVGELEKSSGFYYFNHYMFHMSAASESEKLYIYTIIALIVDFLSDNFKLIKLDKTISDHVYYVIKEKVC